MSLDFRVLECTTDDLEDNDLEYNFLDYVSIQSEDYICYYKIANSSIPRRFEESTDGYDELRAYNSIVYKKEELLDLIEDEECGLQEELKELIEQTDYDYIILQAF